MDKIVLNSSTINMRSLVFIRTPLFLRFAFLPLPTIGVPARTIAATLGASTSTMATRTPAPVRATHTMCVLFGLFNYLSI